MPRPDPTGSAASPGAEDIVVRDRGQCPDNTPPSGADAAGRGGGALPPLSDANAWLIIPAFGGDALYRADCRPCRQCGCARWEARVRRARCRDCKAALGRFDAACRCGATGRRIVPYRQSVACPVCCPIDGAEAVVAMVDMHRAEIVGAARANSP